MNTLPVAPFVGRALAIAESFSAELKTALSWFVESRRVMRVSDAARAEAAVRLRELEAALEPKITRDRLRVWLGLLNGAFRNPLEGNAFNARAPSFALALADWPACLFDAETARLVALNSPDHFWPGAGDVAALLQPERDRILLTRWALRELSAAPESGHGQGLAAQWARVRGRLRAEIGEVDFRLELADARVGELHGDELSLLLPTMFMCDWVRKRRGDRLTALWQAENSDIRRIEFCVEQGAGTTPTPGSCTRPPSPPEVQAVVDGVLRNLHAGRGFSGAPLEAAATQRPRPAYLTPEQLALLQPRKPGESA